jgi:tRNA A-37 threonylcarbamoyl transferase component Bud32/regulator of protease activity HflC (stomatin/prohibitin superfamily)
MDACPSRDQLERLLAEQLPDSDRRWLDGHLATCANCRAELDRLTTDVAGQSVERMTERRGSDATDPALAALLRRMRDAGPPAVRLHVARSVRPPEAPLRFPGPPGADAPLGQLGVYQIRERLGSGANGVLYKAHDSKLGRMVAVKVLRQELAALATARQRFEREARAAASLKHDHIVMVYDVVAPDDFPPYLVMEYIAGEPLSVRLERDGPFDPAAAAGLVLQVARGLAAAHEHGVVHRDIKPSNIMLDESTGRAKITDFGLARAAESTAAITLDGTIAGTPSYMSPEQITAPASVDGRSDVYSLGVVLYELLTGEVPFRGITRMVLHQVLHDEPRPLRRLNDRVPTDLQTICLKAMAKDAPRRYATAADFADDLQRWRAGEPIHARPVTLAERAWRWTRRNPGVAGLSAVSLALLATVALGATVTAVRIDRAKRRADSAGADALAALSREQQARRDAEQARSASDQSRREAMEALDREQRARRDAELAQREAEAAKQRLADALGRETRARSEAEQARRAAEAAKGQAEAALSREKQARRNAVQAQQETEAARQQVANTLEREKQARRAAEQAQADADLARLAAEESARVAAQQTTLALRSLNRLGAAALDVLLQDAQRLEADGQLAEALDRYEQTLTHVRDGRLVGVPPLLLHNRVLVPALQGATALHQQQPNSTSARRLAVLLAFQGQLLLDQPALEWPFPDAVRAALESYERAVQLDAKQAGYLVGRADARLRILLHGPVDAAAFKLAVQDVHLATQLDPRAVTADVIWRLAAAYQQHGDTARADEAYARLIPLARDQRSPHLGEYLFDWSWSALAAGRLDEARQRAAQVKPVNPAGAALVIGESYERDKDPQRALREFDAGLPPLAQTGASHALLLAGAARVRVRLANDAKTPEAEAQRLRGEAVEQLRRAIVLAPQHALAWYWHGLLARQLKIFLDGPLDEARRASYRREALGHADRALAAAPREAKDELQRLREQLTGR